MRRCNVVAWSLSLLLGVLLAVSPAAAETIDERHATLGWQSENAALIARVQHVSEVAAEAVGDGLAARFEVLETLAGSVRVGAEIVVRAPDTGTGAPWTPGAEHLVFLRRGAGGAYVSVSGSLGIRHVPEQGAERRLADVVSAYLGTLGDEGAVRDADALRALLVGWLADEDTGIVWSAAVDLHRHAELHAGLSAAERRAVLDAYRAHPIGKMSKGALARVLADARPPGAAAALLDTLGRPQARTVRGDVAEALVALGAPGVAAQALARLPAADAALRANLVLTLGVLGDGAAAGAVRRRLADDDADVRVQAAHALGRIARAVRAADPDARIDGRSELVAMVATARTANEQKAGTWALAQLDQPASYAQLRRMAKDDPREDVRRYAARYLERPRVALILR